MRILSLFDGIGCGRVALERAGIPIDIYIASEIDKDSIRVAKKNYPDIIQIGDVREVDFSKFENIDAIIGGSPCSYFSNARTSFQETRERYPNGTGYELFTYFAKAVKQIKPRYFLYENNYSMSKEVRNQITLDLGVKPVMIDSALVTAQSRKRYYWTNIDDVLPPKDRNILIGDVIEGAVTGAAFRNQLTKKGYVSGWDIRKDHKSNCLLTFATKRNCAIQMQDGSIRPLTADEYELLQTLPQGYTDCLSESGRKTVCALGWTVDVLAYIFQHMEESEHHIRSNYRRKLF